MFKSYLSSTRMWIYPIELAEGCHTLKIWAKKKLDQGMLGFVVWKNTANEISNGVLSNPKPFAPL